MMGTSSFLVAVQIAAGVVSILAFIGTLWKILTTVVNSQRTLNDFPKLVAKFEEHINAVNKRNQELDVKLSRMETDLDWFKESLRNLSDLRGYFSALADDDRERRRPRGT